MNQACPLVYLVRHGETQWSITGQHTGLCDIPMTANGEREAELLRDRLKRISFDRILTSPLQRAMRTCELAGFGQVAYADQDLTEWHYGDYEGKTSAQIHEQRPDWNLFRDGCPDGESVAEISARADRIVSQLSSVSGTALVFSHSHFLRVLTARWLKLEATAARCFFLNTASVSVLGYEHGREDPVIRLWNDRRHHGVVM
ncbi:histidine phosphatase family protein [Schlesneria paludicola]|uniref:histidine phosphatase family protein n=1 Tax=Schlesneria paludicola TaxID=360056 RepID=UPI00029A7F57|nr:histidine phosphatase family protein [Schlesneria paludicola]